MKYEGLIFDLDGVLVTTDSYHYLAWKKLSDEIGVYFDEKINNRLRGVSRMESLEIILERAEKEFTQDEKISMAEQKNVYYKKLLENLDDNALINGAKEFVMTVREKGVKTAIGSSSKNAMMILKKTNILSLFDAVADGNDIQNSKPAPDVFLKAAEKLGVQPETCLVIEDAVAGVSAAISAGMDVVAVGDAKKDIRATYCVQDLKVLKNIL